MVRQDMAESMGRSAVVYATVSTRSNSAAMGLTGTWLRQPNRRRRTLWPHSVPPSSAIGKKPSSRRCWIPHRWAAPPQQLRSVADAVDWISDVLPSVHGEELVTLATFDEFGR